MLLTHLTRKPTEKEYISDFCPSPEAKRATLENPDAILAKRRADENVQDEQIDIRNTLYTYFTIRKNL